MELNKTCCCALASTFVCCCRRREVSISAVRWPFSAENFLRHQKWIPTALATAMRVSSHMGKIQIEETANLQHSTPNLRRRPHAAYGVDRKSTRLNSSHLVIS